MSALEQYKKLLGQISQAKKWGSHLTTTGRDGKCGVIHSVSANPSLCNQYSTGGKNYWDCKEETSEAFQRKLNEVIAKHLKSHIDEAVSLMQAEADKFKSDAKAEYKALFDEEIAA